MKQLICLTASAIGLLFSVAVHAMAGGLSDPISADTALQAQPMPSAEVSLTLYGGVSYSDTNVIDTLIDLIPDGNCESPGIYVSSACVSKTKDATANSEDHNETVGVVAGARLSVGPATAGLELNVTENLTTAEPQLGLTIGDVTGYAYRAFDVYDTALYYDGFGVDLVLDDGVMIGAKGNEDNIALRVLFTF